jgi:hypothetical protein
MVALKEIRPQQRLFDRVLAGLRSIGYQGALLETDYVFRDWFQSGQPERKVPAAAFAQTPVSYDNACFAVVRANGKSDQDLIADYRALGAPRAFEVRNDCVVHWRVSWQPSIEDRREVLKLEEIPKAFRRHADEWNPEFLLRAKNITTPPPRQLDFVDLGLIPALEEYIHEKLDSLLCEIMYKADKLHRKRARCKPDFDELVRLVFRALTGKVMHDRGLSGFQFPGGVPNADELLKKVGEHYGDTKPIVRDQATREQVVHDLWESIGFQNLSVEVLSYIWENTLVDPQSRKSHSIFATPPSIARYMIRRLPIEKIPQDQRRIVEPCCGCGTFLIAALQRLRELLPAGISGARRHSYFVRMLNGFDIEAFGLEVARSCLTLADLPNPNGWVLEKEDVLAPPERAPHFHHALRNAAVVLCNPPFGKSGERQKPAELLSRVLEQSRESVLLGFVLPRAFLSGAGYRNVRRRIAERYDEIEIVSLPDRVFAHAEFQTTLLLASHARSKPGSMGVLHRKVNDTDRQVFLREHSVSREDRASYELTEAEKRIEAPNLQAIWERAYPSTVQDATGGAIHRGIEWNLPLREKDTRGKRIPIEENKQKLTSDRPKPGFRRGLRSAEKGFYSYQCPPVSYLSIEKKNQRSSGAFNLPWDRPKVIVNKNRKGRGPWCLAAYPDTSGLICYDSFISLWPKGEWTATLLAAIINSPVANAFVAVREDKRNIRRKTLGQIPLPRFSPEQQQEIVRLVEEYERIWDNGGLRTEETDSHARSLLRRIDAVVLKGYNLPPRLEKELLDYFQGDKRPVPFDFGDYYPRDFKPYVPLWMFDSFEFQKSTAANFLQNAPTITDPELAAVLNELG